jgi:hypothetical protein
LSSGFIASEYKRLGGFLMKYLTTLFLTSLFLLTLAAQPMLAKDDYPLTIKVQSTKNIESEHGSFHLAKVGGNMGAAWSHNVAEHVIAVASDGNTYELVPQNKKDMLLPGSFQAKIERRDMKVCEPKDNGKCRDVKFKIVAAEPTANGATETKTDPK